MSLCEHLCAHKVTWTSQPMGNLRALLWHLKQTVSEQMHALTMRWIKQRIRKLMILLRQSEPIANSNLLDTGSRAGQTYQNPLDTQSEVL